jgi:hypothetical protein
MSSAGAGVRPEELVEYDGEHYEILSCHLPEILTHTAAWLAGTLAGQPEPRRLPTRRSCGCDLRCHPGGPESYPVLQETVGHVH